MLTVYTLLLTQALLLIRIVVIVLYYRYRVEGVSTEKQSNREAL